MGWVSGLLRTMEWQCLAIFQGVGHLICNCIHNHSPGTMQDIWMVCTSFSGRIHIIHYRLDTIVNGLNIPFELYNGCHWSISPPPSPHRKCVHILYLHKYFSGQVLCLYFHWFDSVPFNLVFLQYYIGIASALHWATARTRFNILYCGVDDNLPYGSWTVAPRTSALFSMCNQMQQPCLAEFWCPICSLQSGMLGS